MFLLHRRSRVINQGRSLNCRALQEPGPRIRRTALDAFASPHPDCPRQELRDAIRLPEPLASRPPWFPRRLASRRTWRSCRSWASGCPNDQTPIGARVRRTSFQALRSPLPESSAQLPKCFASSACKAGPRASPCVVSVSGDRRICSGWTELAQEVSRTIF